MDESPLSAGQLRARFDRLRQRYAKRDTRMAQVRSIREGRMSEVAPDIFPDTGPWQEPIVANMIDVAARDMAEMLAPLPAFNCSSPGMESARAQERATKKTKIALGYITQSDLQVQMYSAADKYVTYGMLPFRVEIDHESQMPLIRALDPVGCYPEIDRFGRVISLFQRVLVTKDELCALYPHMEPSIKKAGGIFGSSQLEVVFYHDKDIDCAMLLAGGGNDVILDYTKNPLGKCMVRVAQRPGTTDVPRGQFDDVIFVQLAKSRFALLALQAAHESVNAPIVVPSDVPDIPMGPGATIRTNNPQGVGRLPLNVPPEAFQEQGQLERELQLGARFPQARSGNTDASIVTGKGVQALMDGYDSQVRGHQAIFARVLQELVSLCFEVDQAVFGGTQKRLRGTAAGTPYEITYTPSKDIADDYTVDVKYGLMAGLDPNRWLVFALQARAEKMFSRDFMRREMPIDIDVEQEAKKIDIEDLEEAAKQAVMGYAQAIPALASQGQDPSQIIEVLGKVIAGRRKGRSLSDVVAEAFAPPEPTPEEIAAAQAQEQAQDPMAAAAGAEGLPPGLMADGRVQGVAAGMQGELPGGRPDLKMMLASMDARGNPNLQAGVSRQRAI